MGKIAFIYPGQGAQYVGMGKDFYENSETAKAVYDKASECLSMDLKKLCFEENEELNLTQYTQPAMVATEIALTKAFIEKTGIRPDVTAGLSLGEYAALYAAGVLSEEDAVRAVAVRGRLMESAVPAGRGAMAAVLGMDAEKIEAVLETVEGAYIANYNCPGQIVITGKKESVELAAEKLKEAGAKRCLMLKVSGPFHSPLLKEAGEKLAKELEKVTFADPEIPYIANVNAEYVTSKDCVLPLLEKQVSGSVRWQQTIEAMLADGVDTFYEIGPGRTLAGFMKKITKEPITVKNIDKYEDMA